MPFEVHIDTSDYAIGGVLKKNGLPIAYNSKKLDGYKKRCQFLRKKLFAIVHCLKTRQYYLGLYQTKVYPSNVSMKYFETQTQLSAHQLRCHNTLAVKNVELIHKLGHDNVIPNVLSEWKEFQAMSMIQAL